jgi:hypothetical protein
VRGQVVRVGVDPRVELLSIVFRLAGNPEYNQGRLAAYDSSIEAHFGGFRGHPAVTRATQLRSARGVSFDAVMSFAIHITDVDTLAERRPFDAPTSSLERRWTPEDARAFLADLRRFVADADFAGFLRAQRALHDTATARARALMEKEVDLPWFRTFFGEDPRGGFVLAPGLANGGGNFGPKFRFEDGTEEAWAVLGVWLTDSAGLPRFDGSLVTTVIHEFNHSFVNHVTAGHRTALAPAGEKAFARVEREMRSMAYSNWATMIDESLVRASVARYVLAHSGPAAARAELIAQQARGFFWVEGLYDRLAAYESERERYPTFASFMPRLVAWYDSLPARLDSLQAAFRRARPGRTERAAVSAASAERDAAADAQMHVGHAKRVLHAEPQRDRARCGTGFERAGAAERRREVEVGAVAGPAIGRVQDFGREFAELLAHPAAELVHRDRQRGVNRAPARVPQPEPQLDHTRRGVDAGGIGHELDRSREIPLLEHGCRLRGGRAGGVHSDARGPSLVRPGAGVRPEGMEHAIGGSRHAHVVAAVPPAGCG